MISLGRKSRFRRDVFGIQETPRSDDDTSHHKPVAWEKRHDTREKEQASNPPGDGPGYIPHPEVSEGKDGDNP
jgi:hypothetical protein